MAKGIIKIINEEFVKLLREMGDVDYELYEKQDELKQQMLNDFLMNNTPDLTKRIYWRVVPAARLKKIWSDYIKLGFVRDEKGIDMIEGIMVGNALRLEVLSDSLNKEDYEDAWGYYVDDFIGRIIKPPYVDPNQTEIPYDDPTQPFKRKEDVYNFEPNQNFNIGNRPFEAYLETLDRNNLDGKKIRHDLMEILLDYFYNYYTTDSKGIDIRSDYGTKPLIQLAFELKRENNYPQKVVIIDKMLNVVHQRSDLASWFIEGGSQALSDISGYDVPSEPDSHGWGGMQSKISGQYKMSDYSE